MSKPSGTNYPKTFRTIENSKLKIEMGCVKYTPIISIFTFQFSLSLICLVPMCQNHYFWWLWSECSPLPIPNREVKPHIADDTALVCGKVGRRQSFKGNRISVPFFCASADGNSLFLPTIGYFIKKKSPRFAWAFFA